VSVAAAVDAVELVHALIADRVEERSPAAA
jgi:hypothetical protein